MVWSLVFVGAKEELGAEHGVVLLDRHDLGLVMKMELQCHDVTAAWCEKVRRPSNVTPSTFTVGQVGRAAPATEMFSGSSAAWSR